MSDKTQLPIQESPLYFLVYVSTAVNDLSQEELVELMRKSSASNAKRNVTGMLLSKERNFMQVLEGSESAVRSLHAIIAADPRHKGLITILQGPLKERQFANWSMGFRNLNDPSLRDNPAYSEFMNTRLSSEEFAADSARCWKVLLTFKQNMGS